jgi:glycosyltransferase involved in cell wall biosynthesis
MLSTEPFVAMISVIIPAFNEAQNIGLVVQGLWQQNDENGSPLVFEIIVADNNSTDNTGLVAAQHGARVIHVPQKGYGNACAQACSVAHGDVFLFVDGDHTADLTQIGQLLAPIQHGADLVIGNRVDAQAGSMTAAQRFGNALACFLIRQIWSVPVQDLGPFRAIRRTAFEEIQMRDRAYGWTIEMQIRAAQLNLAVVQVPVRWLARHAGHSKVSGTVKGVVGAGWGILSTICILWFREKFFQGERHAVQIKNS